jgi:hypothetical protein
MDTDDEMVALAAILDWLAIARAEITIHYLPRTALRRLPTIVASENLQMRTNTTWRQKPSVAPQAWRPEPNDHSRKPQSARFA